MLKSNLPKKKKCESKRDDYFIVFVLDSHMFNFHHIWLMSYDGLFSLPTLGVSIRVSVSGSCRVEVGVFD